MSEEVPDMDTGPSGRENYKDWTSQNSKVIKYGAKFYSLETALATARAEHGRVYEYMATPDWYLVRVPRKVPQ